MAVQIVLVCYEWWERTIKVWNWALGRKDTVEVFALPCVIVYTRSAITTIVG
jgi:hypothetical protein